MEEINLKLELCEEKNKIKSEKESSLTTKFIIFSLPISFSLGLVFGVFLK